MLDWDGVPVVSVSLSAARTLARALTPKFDGRFVEELVTIETANEPSRVYRWRNGDVIERCDHGAYVSRLDDPKVMLIDLEMIARDGDEWPDTHAIASSVETETSARTETFSELATLSTRNSVRGVRLHTPPMGISIADVDAAFDETFGGEL